MQTSFINQYPGGFAAYRVTEMGKEPKVLLSETRHLDDALGLARRHCAEHRVAVQVTDENDGGWLVTRLSPEDYVSLKAA